MDVDPKAFDVAKLPTIAKDDATVKKKLEEAKKKPTGDRGVLFLGRIPHGFYEEQMKAYFSQFGNVTRLRVSRNKKTGQSKHYGFIEFDSSSVAKIVADTMDNYLLHGHLLQCKLIPKEEVHPELWIGANRKWRAVPADQLTRAKHNKKREEEDRENIAKRLVKRQNQRKRKLEQLGIKYDFEAVGYVSHHLIPCPIFL
ncbi:RNA-binding domain-containing protein [Coprinopsis marcescibilis]|uniref:RNA-binding domain-containing protein n=1 Tax=Coprinopsis marcescibilis TaxID=230819 RepID=A0A5C3KLJ0_COPMA|nr:RNA-binding domain-containing protein [Coprinopsis marcescibilis]